MARLPLVEQRKQRMAAAMTGAAETFYILSVLIRWFRLGCLIINHMIESNTLRKKYRMNFDNEMDERWKWFKVLITFVMRVIQMVRVFHTFSWSTILS
uniref:Basic helix-loop-helix (BHLH) DNA-binding superfamily protein n=1 Tax=Tanacetum cinerariifolium TaxID=118510 RepID=A0A6L2K5X0_TANCI|nr:basic helix-loop-helix (bHLH) DNA-binding superfamily protein [Tanacetum cinerariifolium]